MYNPLLPTPRPSPLWHLGPGAAVCRHGPRTLNVALPHAAPWAREPGASEALPTQPLCSLRPNARQTLGKLPLGKGEPLGAAPLQGPRRAAATSLGNA